MEEQQNDFFRLAIANPNATPELFVNAGLDASNMTLNDKDYYKKIDTIQNFYKDNNGNFDESKFNSDYQQVCIKYAQMAAYQGVQDYKKQTTYDEDNIFAPLDQRRSSTPVITRISNPTHLSESMQIFGQIGPQVKSDDEIAQKSQVLVNPVEATNPDGTLNMDKAIWDDAPDEGIFTKQFWKNFFDVRVLALWDEDGKHINPVTGMEESHQKGQLKLNDLGDPYYENLDGRNIYGRRVLNKMNVLTPEDSAANQYDFFDSDDMGAKSYVGTVAKNLALVGSMFIPEVGPWIAFTSMAVQAARLGAIASKFVNGDSEIANWIEGFATSVDRQLLRTVYDLSHAWSFNNFISGCADLAAQMQEQRAIFNTIPGLFNDFKFIKNTKDQTKIYQQFMSNALKRTQNNGLKEAVLSKATKQDVLAALKALSEAQALGDAAKIADAEKTLAFATKLYKTIEDAAKAAINPTAIALSIGDIEAREFFNNYNKIGEALSKMYMAGLISSNLYTEARTAGIDEDTAAVLTLGRFGAEMMLLYTPIGDYLFPELHMNKMQYKALTDTIIKDVSEEMQKIGTKNLSGMQKYAWNRWLFDYAKKIPAKGREILKYKPGDFGNFKGWAESAGVMGFEAGLVNDIEAGLDDLAKAAYHWITGNDNEQFKAFENIWDRYGMGMATGLVGGSISAGFTLFKGMQNMNHMSTHEALEKVGYMIRNKEIDDYLTWLNKNSTVIGNKYLTAVPHATIDGEYSFLSSKNSETADITKMSLNLLLKANINRLITDMQTIMDTNGVNVTDSTLLNNQILGDIRLSYFLKTKAADRFLLNFNTKTINLVEEAVKFLPKNNVTDSNLKKAEEATKSDSQSKTGDTAKLQELIDDLLDTLKGKYAAEFALDAMYELHPILLNLFAPLLLTLDNYIEWKTGQSAETVADETKSRLIDEYNKLRDSSDLTLEMSKIFINKFVKGTAEAIAKASDVYKQSISNASYTELQNAHTKIYNMFRALFETEHEPMSPVEWVNHLKTLEDENAASGNITRSLLGTLDPTIELELSLLTGKELLDAFINSTMKHFGTSVLNVLKNSFISPEIRNTLMDEFDMYKQMALRKLGDCIEVKVDDKGLIVGHFNLEAFEELPNLVASVLTELSKDPLIDTETKSNIEIAVSNLQRSFKDLTNYEYDTDEVTLKEDLQALLSDVDAIILIRLDDVYHTAEDLTDLNKQKLLDILFITDPKRNKTAAFDRETIWEDSARLAQVNIYIDSICDKFNTMAATFSRSITEFGNKIILSKPNSDIETVIKQFMPKAGDDSLDIIQLLDKLNTLYFLAKKTNLTTFASKPLMQLTEKAIVYLKGLYAAIMAARTDLIGLDNPYGGYNNILNKIVKNYNSTDCKTKLDWVELPEIEGPAADVLANDVFMMINKLEFYLDVLKANSCLLLNKQYEVQAVELLNFYKGVHAFFSGWRDDKTKLLKEQYLTAIGTGLISDETFNSVAGESANSNIQNSYDALMAVLDDTDRFHFATMTDRELLINSINKDSKQAMLKEAFTISEAIYRFGLDNPSLVKTLNENSIKALFNVHTLGLDLLKSSHDVLDLENTSYDPATLLETILSCFVGPRHMFYKEALAAYEDGQAMIPSLLNAISLGYAHFLNLNIFNAYHKAIRESIKDWWITELDVKGRQEAIKKLKLANMETYADDKYSTAALLFFDIPLFDNTFFMTGMPGVGKSKVCAAIVQKMILKKVPSIKNIAYVHTSEESARILKSDITHNEKADATNCFGHADFIKKITVDYKEDDKPKYKYNETTGLVETALELKDDPNETPFDLIIIDEVGRNGILEQLAISNYAKKHGIFVLTLGDLEQSHKIEKIDMNLVIQGAKGTYILTLHDNNFGHGLKMGLTMRADNEQQQQNTVEFRKAMHKKHNTGETFAFRYAEKYNGNTDESGLFGTKVITKSAIENDNSRLDYTDPNCADVIDEIKTLIKALGENEYIGVIYSNTKSLLYTSLNKAENAEILKHVKLYAADNIKTDAKADKHLQAQGFEHKFYVVEAISNSNNEEAYLASVYTGISRAKRGTILVTNLPDGGWDFNCKFQNSKENQPIPSYYSETDIKRVNAEFKEGLEETLKEFKDTELTYVPPTKTGEVNVAISDLGLNIDYTVLPIIFGKGGTNYKIISVESDKIIYIALNDPIDTPNKVTINKSDFEQQIKDGIIKLDDKVSDTIEIDLPKENVEELKKLPDTKKDVLLGDAAQLSLEEFILKATDNELPNSGTKEGLLSNVTPNTESATYEKSTEPAKSVPSNFNSSKLLFLAVLPLFGYTFNTDALGITFVQNANKVSVVNEQRLLENLSNNRYDGANGIIALSENNALVDSSLKAKNMRKQQEILEELMGDLRKAGMNCMMNDHYIFDNSSDKVLIPSLANAVKDILGIKGDVTVLFKVHSLSNPYSNGKATTVDHPGSNMDTNTTETSSGKSYFSSHLRWDDEYIRHNLSEAFNGDAATRIPLQFISYTVFVNGKESLEIPLLTLSNAETIYVNLLKDANFKNLINRDKVLFEMDAARNKALAIKGVTVYNIAKVVWEAYEKMVINGTNTPSPITLDIAYLYRFFTLTKNFQAYLPTDFDLLSAKYGVENLGMSLLSKGKAIKADLNLRPEDLKTSLTGRVEQMNANEWKITYVGEDFANHSLVCSIPYINYSTKHYDDLPASHPLNNPGHLFVLLSTVKGLVGDLLLTHFLNHPTDKNITYMYVQSNSASFALYMDNIAKVIQGNGKTISASIGLHTTSYRILESLFKDEQFVLKIWNNVLAKWAANPNHRFAIFKLCYDEIYSRCKDKSGKALLEQLEVEINLPTHSNTKVTSEKFLNYFLYLMYNAQFKSESDTESYKQSFNDIVANIDKDGEISKYLTYNVPGKKTSSVEIVAIDTDYLKLNNILLMSTIKLDTNTYRSVTFMDIVKRYVDLFDTDSTDNPTITLDYTTLQAQPKHEAASLQTCLEVMQNKNTVGIIMPNENMPKGYIFVGIKNSKFISCIERAGKIQNISRNANGLLVYTFNNGRNTYVYTLKNENNNLYLLLDDNTHEDIDLEIANRKAKIIELQLSNSPELSTYLSSNLSIEEQNIYNNANSIEENFLNVDSDSLESIYNNVKTNILYGELTIAVTTLFNALNDLLAYDPNEMELTLLVDMDANSHNAINTTNLDTELPNIFGDTAEIKALSTYIKLLKTMLKVLLLKSEFENLLKTTNDNETLINKLMLEIQQLEDEKAITGCLKIDLLII